MRFDGDRSPGNRLMRLVVAPVRRATGQVEDASGKIFGHLTTFWLDDRRTRLESAVSS